MFVHYLGILVLLTLCTQYVHGWPYGTDPTDYQLYSSDIFNRLRRKIDQQQQEQPRVPFTSWLPFPFNTSVSEYGDRLHDDAPPAGSVPDVQKRYHYSNDPFAHNVPLPWSCEQNVLWSDLGPDHFPRYLRKVQCRQTNCWYGRYRCVPKTFDMKVLCLATSGCFGSSDDIPVELKPMWRYKSVSVTYACECGRS